EMAALCEASPLPIALDEELIGVTPSEEREKLLQTIRPQFIILKPTLVGGFKNCDHWISLAGKQKIGWWITSALESNIGLNAIAQYTATKNNSLPQGLGTGALFTNNIGSPLQVVEGTLHYNKKQNWDTAVLAKVL
ncbi:MAG: o-succinylbenzoate synthase, partial [Marinirhabdus sp.]|nr:o-succinylbenzoate synthase [Marinirhabdus sp.]